MLVDLMLETSMLTKENNLNFGETLILELKVRLLTN